MTEPATPTLEHLFTIDVKLAPPIDIGPALRGERKLIPIVGGTFSGPKLSGEVLNLGADWHTVFGDGSSELDTRYALRTDDGAVIDLRNFGYRSGPPEILAGLMRGEHFDPALYYMRTQARFETGDPRYAWLNTLICVGSGARFPNAVLMAIYAVR